MELASLGIMLIGLIVGLVVAGAMVPSYTRRVCRRYTEREGQLEADLADLRREQAADRETNRRLRHDLAVNTPEHLELTREERDWALAELDRAKGDLADRDRSLREARLAIQEIRVDLEENGLIERRRPRPLAAVDGLDEIGAVFPVLSPALLDEPPLDTSAAS
ncbi:MAG: hypothetical protein ACK5PP_14135 [Acidimicrobiales bacterium]